MVKDPRVKEALLYERLDGSVRCVTCERRCVVEPGETGFCGTRKNIDGRLNTLVYGDISAVAVHPIEHKPLFHCYPGRYQNTSCPSCGELLTERHGFGFDFFEYRMGPDKRCPNCGKDVPIIGEPVIVQETGRSFRWNP